MYISSIILIITYILIILYVYYMYNHDEKPTEQYDIYREKLDIEPTEAAYLENKECNNINLILADILTLVNKQYIDLQVEKGDKTEYIFTKTSKTDFENIKNHEMMSYNLFFKNNDTVYLNKYLENLNTSNEAIEDLEIKMLTMKRSLDIELQNSGIIDEQAEKMLFKFNKLSIALIWIFLLILLYAIIIKDNEFSELSYLGILFSILLNKTTGLKEERITTKGANVLEKTKGYKKYLKEYLNAKDKPIYMFNVLEYNYIMAVAFGMAKLGEKEFIEGTYKKVKRKNTGMSIIITVILISIILILAI